MSTTTEATEGQAKIREALERMLHVGGKLKTSLEKVYEFNTKADRSGAEFNRKEWDALEYVAHEALAALDASPPIVGELTEEEIKRIAEHESEFAQHFADGLRYARDHGYLAQAPHSSLAPKHLNLEDEARVWYGDNYDYVTASNQHAIRMLAAFASHVLSLSPSAQGVTVDDDWIDEVAHKWAVSQWTDREDMQDQRMTEFGHAVRILRFALLTK